MAVAFNSREARNTVTPKITARAASGSERDLLKGQADDEISTESCMPARIPNERPTSVMKKAATVIEPKTMLT